MLLDLRENQMDNIKILEEEKNKFIPSKVSGFNNFLLLLSPGYQGLPKSILDNIIEDHNIERIFLLYCNRNKLNRDLQYISNKRRINIISEDIFDLFPNTKYCELFLQVNFIK